MLSGNFDKSSVDFAFERLLWNLWVGEPIKGTVTIKNWIGPWLSDHLRLKSWDSDSFTHLKFPFFILLRSWAGHVKELVENTWVRSLEVEPIFVCGGWKMNAAQCVAGVQRLHSSGAGKAHLTSVLRCNFTAMQTDHFRTKAQQSFKLQQTTGITMFESASEKKFDRSCVSRVWLSSPIWFGKVGGGD